MRIAFLSASGQLGGAEWSLLDRLASLRGAFPDWELSLLAGGTGPLLARAAELGVDARALPFPPDLAAIGDSRRRSGAGKWALPRALVAGGLAAHAHVRALRRELAGLSPQVVHSYSLKTHVLGVRAAPEGVPVLWNVQDYPSPRPVMAVLLRWHAGRAAAAVCCSQDVAEDVRRVCGDRLPVHTVYNAVDLGRFSPHGPELDLDARSGLPAPEAPVVRIGLLGTLARWKGHDTFLRALSLLPAETPVRAYVVGGALYETAGSQHSLEELRSLADALAIGGRVGFTGFTESPADAIRALDVVVHASTEPEPFGRVVVEAMACGRAVVASHAGGVAELVAPEVDALVHPPGNARALAHQLTRLVTDPGLRERLGRAAVETARRRFDRARLAGELASIYHSVLERGA